ncbi:MAG TPA: hypothetical protein VIR58_08365 [Acidimicrobiales bacterium]
MTKKLLAALFSILAITLFVAGCGDDDSDESTNEESTVEDEATEEEATEEEATDDEGTEEEVTEGEVDPATVEAFLNAINEDQSILCDPDNATEDFLASMGGEEACLQAAEANPSTESFEIVDITVDGATATAELSDSTGTRTVEFVQEGDQLKVSGLA